MATSGTYTKDCCGGQPVQDTAHAATVLAQGNKHGHQVPQAVGMKDQSAAGQKLTGR